jgi:hypothetical protein
MGYGRRLDLFAKLMANDRAGLGHGLAMAFLLQVHLKRWDAASWGQQARHPHYRI